MKAPLALGVALVVAAGATVVSQVRTIPTPGMRPVAGPISTVAGQVVDEAGRPVPKTATRLVGERSVQTLLTDARGRFSYDNVVPGEYVLVASKYGYFDGAYGKRRAGGAPLPFSLAATQSIPDMRVELFRAAVVTGSVLDEGREPIAGARVIAARRTFADGEWRYTAAGEDTTDDRGQYRMYGLEPGEYIVSTPTIQVTGKDGSVLTPLFLRGVDDQSAYPTQYFPSSTHLILALPIALTSGEVRYAVDFAWASVPARNVTGRLIGDISIIEGQLVRLVARDAATFAGKTEAAATLSTSDGSFAFRNVPAGEYRLEAGTAFLPGADEIAGIHWGSVSVDVIDEDVKDVAVLMRRGRTLSGTVELDAEASGAASVQFSRVPLTLVPTGPGLSPMARLQVNGDGEFTRSNLIPGLYYVRVGVLPPGTFLKAISSDQQDALDRPVNLSTGDLDAVRIVLTDRGTEINGSVRDLRMQAASGAAVIVMPASESNWTPNRTRYVRASTNGVFAISTLPAGDYLIVAVDDAATEGWQDVRVLTQLRTLGTRVTLRDGERRTLQLRLSLLRR